MAVILLESMPERTFYEEKWDATAERSLPPTCFAFGALSSAGAEERADDEEQGPHPAMQADLSHFQPQNDICKTCSKNEWGSSDTGRGKACGERRRLAILPAGYYTPKKGSRDFDLHLFTEEEHFAQADIAYLKLNVMSVKDFARFVTQLAATHRRPPLGVVTRVYLEPDPRSQFRVKFEVLELLDATLYDVIMRRHEEAKIGIQRPYPPPSGGDGTSRGVRR